jgi:hypothetical protein
MLCHVDHAGAWATRRYDYRAACEQQYREYVDALDGAMRAFPITPKH